MMNNTYIIRFTGTDDRYQGRLTRFNNYEVLEEKEITSHFDRSVFVKDDHGELIEILYDDFIQPNRVQNIYANSLATSYGDFMDPSYDNKLVGDPNGEPYIIFAHEKGWQCLHVLIFAQSEDDARARIMEALEAIAAIKDRQFGRDPEDVVMNPSRARKVLEVIKKNDMEIIKANKGFVYYAPWAGNDYLA